MRWMQAFRLRGIVADEVASFSEDSLFWPKVKHDLLKVEGLVFGGRRTNGDVLRVFAKPHAADLGFDTDWGKIDAPSFHPMFHTGRTVACSSIWLSDGAKALRRYQSRNVSDTQRRHAAHFPGSSGWRRQAAAKGPVCDPETLDQGAGRVRAKLLSFHRTSARQCGRRWREGPIALSNQLWFIARGGSKMAAGKRQHPGRNGRSPRKSNGASSNPPRPRAKRLRQARLPRQQGLPVWEQRGCAYACIALASVTSFC
jgi:hypothetical protein